MANGHKYFEHYLYFLAVGLTNSKKEPSKKLIDQLRNQLTWDDALSLFLCVAKSMQLESFTNTTVLIKGMDILKTGPMNGEIIAPEVHGLQ